MDENEVKNMFCNPVYVGIGPFPRLVEPDTWITCAKKLIKEVGYQEFFTRMFAELENDFAVAREAEERARGGH